jgi:hypothetical protein
MKGKSQSLFQESVGPTYCLTQLNTVQKVTSRAASVEARFTHGDKCHQTDNRPTISLTVQNVRTSWLKAVVNNALTDFWRRQRCKPERDGVGGTAFLQRLGEFAGPNEADEPNGASERQAKITAADVLARVRARLHETTWQAFYQTLVEKRPAQEVAHELGISISAVYKNTYRVKQMLHEEYRHAYPNDHGAVLSGRDDLAAVPQ